MGPETIPILIELVPAAEGIRSRACLRSALTTLASKDMSKIGVAVGSQDPRVVKEAVAVIGRVADSRGARMLRRCLEHEDVSVRMEAVHALREIGDSESSKVASEFLKDADTEVRIMAVRTIDISRDDSLRKVIEDIVASRGFRLKPTREKIALIDALRLARSDDVVSTFATFFKRGLFRRREGDSVMIAIIGALASIGTEAAKNLLKRASESRRKVVAVEGSKALERFREEQTEGGDRE